MSYTVTPQQWSKARDQIAWAVCEVQSCIGARKEPCREHRAVAEKLLHECVRAFDSVILSQGAREVLSYMRRSAPARGGFMYEGARPALETGEYQDAALSELLTAGLIAPHPDPMKGFIVVNTPEQK